MVSYNTSTGDITVNIQFDDVVLDEDVRWCADDILLPDMAAVYPSVASNGGFSLILDAGKQLTINRNRMPTRIDDPETVFLDGTSKSVFNSATVFTIDDEAKMQAKEGAKILVDEGSTFVLGNDSELELDNAEMNVIRGSTMIIGEDALLDIKGGNGKLFIDKTSKLIIDANSLINLEDYESHIFIQGHVIVRSGANWGFDGNGYIIFDGTIENETGATWILSARGKTDLMLQLWEPIYWENGIVDLSTGLIEIAADDIGIFITNPGTVDVSEVYFDGNTFSNDWEDEKALSIDGGDITITSCDFYKIHEAILLENTTNTALVDQCDFDLVHRAIVATDFENLEITNSEIQSLGIIQSGPYTPPNIGLWATNVDQINMDLTNINDVGYGLYLEAIDGF